VITQNTDTAVPFRKAVCGLTLDLIILAIPVEVVLSRLLALKANEIIPHGRVAIAIGAVLIRGTGFYTDLLWTLFGIFLIYWEAFKKQKAKIGSLAVVATAMIALLCVVEGAAGQIGSDSLGEVTRTQWSQVLSYSLQFLQTSGLTMKHLVAACLPFIFLLAVLLLVKKGVYRPNIAIAILTSIFTVGVLICCLCLDISQFLSARSTFVTYQRNLQDGTRKGLGHFRRVGTAPMVFVYIGESTPRDWLYSELKERMRNPGLSDNVVLFSDVVSPHSHTFLSLVRTLSVSINPERDQLTDDRILSRINLISILKRNGIATDWISNKPAFEWIAALFGNEADEMYLQNKAMEAPATQLKKDSDVLPRALYRLTTAKVEPKVVFFHSQAGHPGYCDFIPKTAVSRIPTLAASLPFDAVYGDLSVLSRKWHLQNVNCARNAVAYVADNVELTMRQMSQINSPAVLIYFSDHGDDALDGTAHDSSRPSFRKIEIPLMVFFNDAAKRAYKSKFDYAVANKDKRYATTWLSDSILDISGISYDERRALSIFGPLDNIPDRYSTLRSYGGKQYVIAVDGDTNSRNSVNTTDIDLYAKKQLIRSLPAEQQGRICVHQADSLLKFTDASKAFSCFELDIVIDPDRHEIYVYDPPKKNSGLTLGTLLELQPKQSTGIWLDVKNAQMKTLEYLLDYLNRRIPPEKRQSTLIEVALNEAENNNVQDVLSSIRQAGYSLSYHLATDVGIRCSDHPEKLECAELAKSIEAILRSTPYTSLSFDILASRYATSIDRPIGVEINTWDLSVRRENDLDCGMLKRVTKYQILYESPFNY